MRITNLHIKEIEEDSGSGPEYLVVYPGRFSPFHKGHKAVYDHLAGKYENVYVATSNKVDPPKSPFSFDEKKKMMELTGMDTSRVVLTNNPYNPMEIADNFDKENTILLIAVSEKDMAEDPRFKFAPKKDGSPSYFQDASKGNLETMDKHGYILTVPTFKFDVLDKPMNSATEVRSMFASLDVEGKKKLIQDLFGNFSVEVFKLMSNKLTESLKIAEGGWTDMVTQKTKLTPAVVQAALGAVEQFTNEFNTYLTDRGHPPVKMGAPTGSSAYHDVDEPDVEYGDIDLQMIAPDHKEMTGQQQASFYNDLVDKFIAEKQPKSIHDQGKPAHGHPIFNIGKDKVQVDLMWTPESTSDWARYRVTPQRGVKGLIYGNMYSSLGDLMNMSIQTAGAQMKTVDGQPVPFSKRKGTELHTLTSDIDNFGLDILKRFYEQTHGSTDGLQVDPELQQFPGLKRENIKITDLAHTVKGLAKSFELNDLFGKFGLEKFSSASQFVQAFLDRIRAKADEAANSPKFNKASTPEELAKVKHVQQAIAKGLDVVNGAFMTETTQHGTDHRRVFGGIDDDIRDATKTLKKLLAKIQSVPRGTKVRSRFMIKFHKAMAALKGQMAINLELRENYGLDDISFPNVITLKRKQETYNLSLTEMNGKVKIKVLETNRTIPPRNLAKLYERGYRKIEETKKMSAQKLGVFAKGKSKVSLWEHNGTIVLVDKRTQRLQETNGTVKQAVDSLHKRGYVCESVSITAMRNAAGAVMNVMYDKIKGTTTVRDEQGGSHTYEAPGEKVIAALMKKGFQAGAKAAGAGDELSLAPTPDHNDAEMRGTGHYMANSASNNPEGDDELMATYQRGKPQQRIRARRLR